MENSGCFPPGKRAAIVRRYQAFFVCVVFSRFFVCFFYSFLCAMFSCFHTAVFRATLFFFYDRRIWDLYVLQNVFVTGGMAHIPHLKLCVAWLTFLTSSCVLQGSHSSPQAVCCRAAWLTVLTSSCVLQNVFLTSGMTSPQAVCCRMCS